MAAACGVAAVAREAAIASVDFPGLHCHTHPAAVSPEAAALSWVSRTRRPVSRAGHLQLEAGAA